MPEFTRCEDCNMISQTAEYALRVVVFLAAADGKGRRHPRHRHGHEDSDRVSRQGASTARPRGDRGVAARYGGFVLARDAGELTVHDVGHVVDPIRRITTCPLGLRAHRRGLCPLHRRLDDAAALVERAFRDSSIAQLPGERS
jgi:DNA-binding IscR family transcriptional regulator